MAKYNLYLLMLTTVSRHFSQRNPKLTQVATQIISDINAAGTYKVERVIESPQDMVITVKGQKVLNFCANNYLGLSNDPRVR